MVVGQRRHLGRVEFNRPPRLREMPAKRQVKIPAPPAAAGRPGGSIMGSLIVPTVSTAAMGSVFLLAALLTQGVQPVVLAASSAALLLGAVLPAAWFFFEDRRRAERETQQQTADYRRRLHNVETELQQLRAQEQAIRLEHDPDAEALLRRARELHRQLWERRAGDDDVLVLRLGLGLARSYVEVGGPEPETAGLTSPEAELAQEARSLAARFALVPDVPIVADLKAAVAVGLTGPAARTRALARSVLCQAATHHSPDELQLVGFFTGESLPEWAWLKWLPHVRPQRELDGGSTLLGWEAQGREQLARWLLNELTNRRRLVLEAGTSEAAPVFPWILVFTDDFATVRAEAAIQLALAEGARLRVAVVGLAENLAALPRGCGGVSAFEPRQGGLLNYTNTGLYPEPIQGMADEVTPELAEEIARALAAVTVVQEQAAGDIPERVSLFEALGIASIERAGVARRWAQLDLAGLLCTPLGAMAEGKLLSLDLKEQALGGQGPHGLVAGTTGAGKSELLLSIIAGLALRHPPHVLNFVLVDYKGGEAFRPVADLPHTVSLITDLDEHLAHRALAFLRSELKLRERRLGELKAAGTGIKHLAEFHARRRRGAASGGSGAAMPLLVIVVDEFARLKAELPEFVHGLIDVARVGRSLGVHLILATQTPSGTVDEEIQNNANFGICLRVRDPGDSRHVIGEPDAFLLPGSRPGRAYFRAGQEPVQLFQAAYVGARYQPRAADEPISLTPFPPDVADPGAPGKASLLHHTADTTTEIEVLVRHLRLVAEREESHARPWPAPLPEELHLIAGQEGGAIGSTRPALLPVLPPGEGWSWPPAEDSPLPESLAVRHPFSGRSLAAPLPASLAALARPGRGPQAAWLAAPIGLLDEPRLQAQHPFVLDASQNCIVYGSAGAGKSHLLRTFATSLALTHAPRDLHLYAIDFGPRALAPLRQLPHCGPHGVFYATETDRIRRLFRFLEAQLAERRASGGLSRRQGRQAGHAGQEGASAPSILVFLDNYAGFRETFEEEELSRSHEQLVADLATLMRDGPAVGIAFVLTATHLGGVLSGVENAAGQRLVLRQKEETDYLLVGRFERPPAHLPPGRGFVPGVPPLEFQVALPPPAGPDEGDDRLWRDLTQRLDRSAGGDRPPPMQDLPRWVHLDDPRLRRPPGTGDRREQEASPAFPVTLGLDDETFGPLQLDLVQVHHLVISGPQGCGKTGLLATCLLSSLDSQLGRRARWYIATPRDSALAELCALPNCAAAVADVESLTHVLEGIAAEVNERRERLRAAPVKTAASPAPRPAARARRNGRGLAPAEANGAAMDDGAAGQYDPLVLVMDDYDLLRQDDELDEVETQLLELAKRGRLVGLHVLVAGFNAELRRYSNQLVHHVAQTGAGVLLQPDLDADGDLFGGLRLRRFSQGEPPPGRGYVILRQQARLFQAATCQTEDASLREALRRTCHPVRR